MRVAGLIFEWPSREWFSLRLLACLGFSAGVHGLAFLLFQVVERDQVTSPAREKEVAFLSGEVPGHQALLALVEAETPMAALSHPLLPVEPELRRPLRSVVPVRSLPLAIPRNPDEGRGMVGWLGEGAEGRGESRTGEKP
jgi:hypothetical protein